MERKASCSCGIFYVRLSGDPVVTAVCNCTNCQRRTGSAFGVGAYFKDAQVIERAGTENTFEDTSDSGNKIIRKFCGTCGTTVYWKADFQPNLIGLAVGCFNDPEFPTPSASVWTRSKLKWVSFPENMMCLPKQDIEKSS